MYILRYLLFYEEMDLMNLSISQDLNYHSNLSTNYHQQNHPITIIYSHISTSNDA